jgi:hypothetical protein
MKVRQKQNIAESQKWLLPLLQNRFAIADTYRSAKILSLL